MRIYFVDKGVPRDYDEWQEERMKKIREEMERLNKERERLMREQSE